MTSPIKENEKEKEIYLPKEILSHICQYCDRYGNRRLHKHICDIIERVGMTRRIMTRDWQGPVEDEFIDWWDSITIPYKVPNHNTHGRIEPLDMDSCLCLPYNEYIKYSYATHYNDDLDWGHQLNN